MLNKVTIILVVAAGLVAYEGPTGQSRAAAASEEAASTTRPHSLQRFGAEVPAGDAVSVADVLTRPAAMTGKTILVEGTVHRVCQRKGCWMEITDSKDPDKGGCRITFKDYGFFVPPDSVGAAARVHGEVVGRTVAAADVEHLEAEGAHFANKAPDGSASEISIVASGVELRR